MDGFGAGQARLLEIAEAPLHDLKFDSSLTRQRDTAPPLRQAVSTLSGRDGPQKRGVFCVVGGIEWKPGRSAVKWTREYIEHLRWRRSHGADQEVSALNVFRMNEMREQKGFTLAAALI
jgi:hypothetical protein